MPDRPSQDRLPIKLILPNQGKQKPVHGGGRKKLFRPVTPEYRYSLARQVGAIREALTPAMRRAGSAPLRVKLVATASAKSHLPKNLFAPDTCPIIGSGALGELFVKGTPKGLNRLEHQITRNMSDRMTKELSSVDAIEPITPSRRLHNTKALEILRHSPKRAGAFLTRVRLFDFGGDTAQSGLVADFEAGCKNRGIALNRGAYTSHTYEARCRTVDDVDALSGIVGVRSIKQMPLIRMLRPKLLNASALPEGLLGTEDVDGDYPIVAVVDSGVGVVPRMEPWVTGRQQDVPPNYRNTTHGTFVGGLICWGAQLNPHLGASIDPHPCGIFDLQVIPNLDPDSGETDFLTEQELLQSLSTALSQHANRIKVWNLSLGSDEVCALDQFSPLAEELDKLQERFQVTFVISAGNYEMLPMLDYPRVGPQLDAGRITSPADSVLGVTVGSISHIDYPAKGPGRNCPSPFSRHGAGPNYIIKPDFVHFGGTCSTDVSHQAGIRSVSLNGSAEDIGTSFANSARLSISRPGPSSHHADPIAGPRARSLDAPCARSSDEGTSARPRGELFWVWHPDVGAVLPSVHTTQLNTRVRGSAQARLFSRVGRFSLSAIAETRWAILRRDRNDRGLRAVAQREVRDRVLRNSY